MSFTNRTSVVTDCEKELANSVELIYVTGPGKIGLTYAQHTFVHIMVLISSSACAIYPKSVNFIKFLMDFCMHDDMLVRYNTDYR